MLPVLEASIWSIEHPVPRVEDGWRSIPYCKPLANQTVEVLDRAMRPCPDHVAGEIHIGGVGLARGYRKDPDRTAERFVVHPSTGARLYGTGDLPGRGTRPRRVEERGRLPPLTVDASSGRATRSRSRPGASRTCWACGGRRSRSTPRARVRPPRLHSGENDLAMGPAA